LTLNSIAKIGFDIGYIVDIMKKDVDSVTTTIIEMFDTYINGITLNLDKLSLYCKIYDHFGHKKDFNVAIEQLIVELQSLKK
jgi:hypothetical protein